MSTRTLSSTELKDIRAALRDFNFTRVMNLLGWNHATGQSTLSAGDDQFTLKPIAQLGGVQVIEVTSQGNPTTLPLEQTRRKLSDELTSTAREHVLIFVDAARTQSHWYWVKREFDGTKRKAQPRTHTYIKGQPDDLFIGKLSGLFVDIAELDDNGELPVLEAARRLSTALDSEAVVKEFYREFKDVREALAEQISGISDPKDRAWYASVLLNRLMFVYFLQGKGFLGRPNPTSDGNRRYLQHKLAASRTEGPDLYYSTFLHHLFFDAFAKPEDQRSQDTKDRTGQIPYLNGGLFLKHGIELKYPGITIPDAAFDGILDLFGKYTWNLSEDDKHANGLDPDVLGHIFEKYINQKGFGAYYTRPEITEYLCEQTVRKLVLDKIKAYRPADTHLHHNLSDALTSADRDLVRHLLTADDGLKQISLLDPACGSGAFLVAALKTMLDIYTVLMGRIHALHDPTLLDWEAKLRGTHASYHYNLKKQIITDNLYGVDLMPEAAEIAKLRLFLSLVSSANTLDDLEPLPNIDFNILTGNSLIGLLEVNESEYKAQREAAVAADKAKEKSTSSGPVNRPTAKIVGQPSMFEEAEKTYKQIVAEYQRDVENYRHVAGLGITDLSALRKQIEDRKVAAYKDLNPMLHKQFHDLGIKYEEVTWDAAKGKEGKTKKRALTLDDITALKPFHWAFEFAEVMARGGFDAVIANPPWDVVKPNGKEFLESYSATISINKMGIKDFEKEKGELLTDPVTLTEWLEYQSSFPHVSAY
ncbi:Eco57I restriction-modification methylase domain-containing protein [Deinococcus aquaticus]|uniref:Eco57I restriction-modification methylase domain-containing protein n=1 Tax=Deinococcus aquaticus TaxID=328692 RepID=UPI003F44A2B7